MVPRPVKPRENADRSAFIKTVSPRWSRTRLLAGTRDASARSIDRSRSPSTSLTAPRLNLHFRLRAATIPQLSREFAVALNLHLSYVRKIRGLGDFPPGRRTHFGHSG